MKFRSIILIVLVFFLTGCGKDADTRTVKVEISEMKGCPAGQKLTAIMYEEPATGFRLKQDVTVPGSTEFSVICKRERKIWISISSAAGSSGADLIDLQQHMNIYVDGEKISYSPVPGGSEYGIFFMLNKKI